MSQTVQMTVNKERLVNVLKFAFNNKMALFTEMAQNARRAGGSFVKFSLSNGDLTVEDDGCGIGDFSKMLAIAESGWSDEVKAKDSPYGLGLLVALHSCSRIVVESCGKRLAADTKSLLAFEPATLEASDVVTGTRITLIGANLKKPMSFETAFKGFPIKVEFDGKEIARPHAVSLPCFEDFECGRIAVEDIETVCSNLSMVVYLQGVRVLEPGRTLEDFAYRNAVVVHLDSTSFLGSAPDRDRLDDGEKQWKRIRKAVTEVVAKKMEEAIERGEGDALANNWSLFQNTGRYDLLSKLTVLPGRLVGTPSDNGLCQTESGRDDFSSWKPVSKAELEEMAVVAAGEAGWDGDGESAESCKRALETVYVAALDGVFVNTTRLVEGHWVFSLPGFKSDLAVAVHAVEGQSQHVTSIDDSVSWEVRFCQSVTLTGAAGEVEVVSMPVPALEVVEGESAPVIFKPHDCSSTDLVEAVKSYIDSREQFREEWRDEDAEAIERFYLSNCCGKPVDALRMCLAEIAFKMPQSGMEGKSFEIGFVKDARGISTLKVIERDAVSAELLAA